MSIAPSIKGDRQEVKAGLFMITCDSTEGKMLAFWNSSKDLQFNLTMQFLEPQVTALGDTKVQENKYAISLYPGETKEFVKGKWKAMKRTLSFGAPDEEWRKKQAAEMDKDVDEAIAVVKGALKQNPKADGKYTSEYIADVCEQTSVSFVDLTFPPRPTSLAREFEQKLPPFAWKRPSAYCPADKPATLFVGEIEPNDIDQGQLGNCYFLCSLACIAEFPNLIKDIFQLPQRPDLGIFRCRMCKNGWWQATTVDDFLPINPATSLPAFAKNREEPNEMWVSLLEKTYAKLHGSYAAIKAGDPALALADMLGAPYEKFKDRPEWDDKEKMFDFLHKCDEEDHIMVLGTPGSDTTAYSGGDAPVTPGELAEKYTAVGLCTGHAFSLIRVKRSHGHKLCMIRNPWGNEKEWNGDWSDDSDKWTEEIKKEVDFVKADDGTFWMSWDDVCKWFEMGSVTYVLTDWTKLRIAGNFEKGVPDIVPEVHISGDAPVQCRFGAHQRDSRGLPSGDKDRKYLGLLLVILHEDAAGRMTKVSTSGKGAFLISRDIFVETALEPSPKPYYVLVQAYQDQEKSFTISSFFESNAHVKVQFVAYRDDAKQKHNPPTKFDPSKCTQRVAANYQVRLPGLGTEHWDAQGECALWASPKKPEKSSAAKPQGKPAAAKPLPKIVAPPQVVKRQKISVGVLAGRNLVSKDINGYSDPFVTLILCGSDLKPYPDVDEKSTKYINATLNPTWGENFLFDVLDTDVFRVECWDKDLFGKDPMGHVDISMSSLGIAPGGPAKMDFFPLSGDDATGDLQLLFVYV